MKKIYSQAPLPFQGQKRKWNGKFKTSLRNFDDCNVFVDLFGGSGLLSRMVKDERPDAVVYYNDFDDYHIRIENISRTNNLVNDLLVILKDYQRKKRIIDPYRTAIIERVREEELKGYVDYITLSSSVLFSANYVVNFDDFIKQTFYNNVRISDYNADGYLDGICITKKDYRELFDILRNSPNVCFLIDPPYLSTDAGTYTNYWKLKDYLDVLDVLGDINYIYFTSNKSTVVELCEWIGNRYSVANPFNGSKKVEIQSNLNYNSIYKDIMLFKHK